MHVNAARATAALVVVLALVTIVAGQWWLYAALAIGFALRVAGGHDHFAHEADGQFGQARLRVEFGRGQRRFAILGLWNRRTTAAAWCSATVSRWLHSTSRSVTRA